MTDLDTPISPLPRPPVFDSIEAERQHRKERLAASFRIFGRFGFDEGVAGHITARDPELTDHFWVLAYGIPFHNATVHDLILVAPDGTIVDGPAGAQVRPFDPGISQSIHIPGAFRHGAEDREVVEVELLRHPRAGAQVEGKILERIGPFDAPGTDTFVVTRMYGLAAPLPPEVIEAAQQLPGRISPTERARREVFDSPSPVTIDGETAQDFDDAIAVETLPGGGYRLFVHIADVSHFVRPGDALDREARRRGTSVYFPGTVLPMFPERLSNDLCSLRPRVWRAVQSAVLDLSLIHI